MDRFDRIYELHKILRGRRTPPAASPTSCIRRATELDEAAETISDAMLDERLGSAYGIFSGCRRASRLQDALRRYL